MALTLLFGQVAVGNTPVLLETGELRDFDVLAEPRKKLIEAALVAAKQVTGMPYRFAGNGVQDGGFDCSGAIYHVMRKVGLNPPRTSSAQYL